MPIPDIDDRSGECQIRLEPLFIDLENVGILEGFSEDETAFALLCLALARIKMREENLKTDEAIARALKAIEGE